MVQNHKYDIIFSWLIPWTFNKLVLLQIIDLLQSFLKGGRCTALNEAGPFSRFFSKSLCPTKHSILHLAVVIAVYLWFQNNCCLLSWLLELVFESQYYKIFPVFAQNIQFWKSYISKFWQGVLSRAINTCNLGRRLRCFKQKQCQRLTSSGCCHFHGGPFF